MSHVRAHKAQAFAQNVAARLSTNASSSSSPSLLDLLKTMFAFATEEGDNALPALAVAHVKKTHPRVDNLVRALTENHATINREIDAARRLNRPYVKQGHWIWWIFPTQLIGAADRYQSGVHDIDEARALLNNAEHLNRWITILDKLTVQVRNTSAAEVFPIKDDRGRIFPHFLRLWLSGGDFAAATAEHQEFQVALTLFRAAFSGKIKRVKSVYDRSNHKKTSFDEMLKDKQHDKSLFIFNDNEEQFLAFQMGEDSGFKAGSGNASIRPFRKQTHRGAGIPEVRAAGIPTGVKGSGYTTLDERTKKIIDDSIRVIYELLKTGAYKKLVYSVDGKGNLGTGIFIVGDKVKKHIVDELSRALHRANMELLEKTSH